jgi:acyl carrier protein
MIFETVKKIISEEFKIPETAIFEDSDIFNDLKFDSLDAVELIISLEEHFGIEMLDAEADNVKTIKEIVDIINSKVS